MIAIPSIVILILTAVMSGVGIAVLRHPRHRGARVLLAGAMTMELLMAAGLTVLVALPHAYF